MAIKRKVIDKTIEKRILIGMITDKEYLDKIMPVIDSAYFEVSYCNFIAKWIIEYYKTYKENPGATIQKIFEDKADSLSKEDVKLVSSLLQKCSDEYMEKGLNTKYLLDKTLEFFRKRSIKVKSDRALKKLKSGDLEGAEKAIAGYRKVELSTMNWFNPFENGYMIREALAIGDDPLLRLSGRTGDLIGNLQRGWFIAFMGLWKRGKTWLLLQMMFEALVNNLRVAFISNEMDEFTMILRAVKQLTALPDEEGVIEIPVFDCVLNQKGICKSKWRSTKESMDSEKYRPCTACRMSKEGKYYPAVYKKKERRGRLKYKKVMERSNAFVEMVGSNMLKMVSYPPYSIGLDKALNDLDLLEVTEGWVPDFIITDQADSFKRNPSLPKRDGIDEIWMNHKALAVERNALVATVSQINMGGSEVENLKMKHISADSDKFAHVDLLGAINQTEKEEIDGCSRLALLVHRHKKKHQVDGSKQVMVLQNFEIGQVKIDDTWYRKYYEKSEDFK